MTAPGTGDRPKTADELVEALLEQDEHRQVLRYARDHGLDKDDTVLFMIGMLKVFAYVWDRLKEMMRIVSQRVDAMHDDAQNAERQFVAATGEHVRLMHKVLNEHVKLTGHNVAQLNVAAGEMKVLTEQMTLVTQDAKRTLAALRALKEAPDKASFTALIDERMTTAIARRTSIVDQAFQEQMLAVIYRGMDQFILRTRIHTVLIVVLAGIVIYLVRR